MSSIQAAVNAVTAVLCLVREIITHKNPDWDSVVAVFLLRVHGREQFKGVESAPVRFSEKTILGTDADHDRDGVVPVDTGKGRFSEHHGKDGRLAGKCACSLVAEFLKLLGRPELAKLVQETRDADNKAESTVTSAPALMKTAYRCGASQSMVFNWATKMVEAIVRHQQYRYDEVAGERTLKQWFDLLVAEDGSILPKNGRIHDFIVRAIEMSMKLKDEKVTELSYVIEALQRTSCEQADIKAMLRFWFGLMVKDQEMFRMEVERIRSIRKMPENSYSVLALCDGRDIRLNLLVLDGADSPHAHRAAMYNDRESGRSPADIVIVRNSSGNVQIYTHKGRCHGVSLDNLWKAIRWLEMPADKRSKISPDQLDNVVDSDRWYYFKLGGAIFNGSLTNEREATCVPRRAMIEAIQFCLHPQGCGKFMELYQPRSIRFNAPRPQKDNGRGNQGRRPADLKDLEKALDRGVPHEGPASKPVALARVA